LVAVAEQFAQASRVSAAEPVSEVKWDLVFEEEQEVFSVGMTM
jgi:hypothetical protein